MALIGTVTAAAWCLIWFLLGHGLIALVSKITNMISGVKTEPVGKPMFLDTGNSPESPQQKKSIGHSRFLALLAGWSISFFGTLVVCYLLFVTVAGWHLTDPGTTNTRSIFGLVTVILVTMATVACIFKGATTDTHTSNPKAYRSLLIFLTKPSLWFAWSAFGICVTLAGGLSAAEEEFRSVTRPWTIALVILGIAIVFSTLTAIPISHIIMKLGNINSVPGAGIDQVPQVNAQPDSDSLVLNSNDPRKMLRDDQLERKYIVDGLAELVKTQPTSFTLGIDGAWGTGKSTIMNMIETELGSQQDIVVVPLNLWQHQNDKAPAVALLQAARDAIGQDPKNTETIKSIDTTINFILAAGWTALSLVLPLERIVSSSDISRQHKRLPEKEEDSEELLDAFQKVITMVLQARNAERLVFILDDLDRCLPDVALDMLEKIHLFFRGTKSVFIFGIDTRIIKLTVERRYAKLGKDVARSLATEYVEKILDFIYFIPPIGSSLGEFIKKQLAIPRFQQWLTSHDPDGNQLNRIVELFEAGLNGSQASLRRTKRLVNSFILYWFLAMKRPPKGAISPDSSHITEWTDFPHGREQDHIDGEQSSTSTLDAQLGQQSKTIDDIVPVMGINGGKVPAMSLSTDNTDETPDSAHLVHFDPWLLATVTAIQVLQPDIYAVLSNPSPSGDDMIYQVFSTDSSLSDNESLKTQLMQKIKMQTANVDLSADKTTMVHEIRSYIELVACPNEETHVSISESFPWSKQIQEAMRYPLISDMNSVSMEHIITIEGQQWIVLDLSHDTHTGRSKALLLSSNSVANLPFDDSESPLEPRTKIHPESYMTWRNCRLRQWLNGSWNSAGPSIFRWEKPINGTVWTGEVQVPYDTNDSSQNPWSDQGFLDLIPPTLAQQIVLDSVKTPSVFWNEADIRRYCNIHNKWANLYNHHTQALSPEGIFQSIKPESVEDKVRHMADYAKSLSSTLAKTTENRQISAESHELMPSSWQVEFKVGPTTDRVFLLSLDEVRTYFGDYDCPLAPARLAGDSWWWLRSPGLYENFAASVGKGGWICYGGDSVQYCKGSVRPAFWLNI